ncbi:hypothetical protein HMPREF1008_00506 [Olsenella sp. oral taxon 809 str. F0356]|nr:hypothetical protein HMPREF1008_00506 [Olsenella sp. oral taxon 809 str. F0356]
MDNNTGIKLSLRRQGRRITLRRQRELLPVR